MRPPTFLSDTLRQQLLRHKIATLVELNQALGTDVALTVLRKLKELEYLTSYSHCGRYYTLRDIARFGTEGLWSYQGVWFSRHGTLLATAQHFVDRAPQGYFAEELAAVLHVQVHDPLRQLVLRRQIVRQGLAGRYLYTCADATTRQRQLLNRRSQQALPIFTDASHLQIAPEELQAAIILFYSLLDEQQRRLYAGLESLKLGHGGDQQLAQFLNLNPHTIARGRQQLLEQGVEFDRVRKTGGGRKPLEKKLRKSSMRSKS
jgi:hypothetical protein